MAPRKKKDVPIPAPKATVSRAAVSKPKPKIEQPRKKGVAYPTPKATPSRDPDPNPKPRVENPKKKDATVSASKATVSKAAVSEHEPKVEAPKKKYANGNSMFTARKDDAQTKKRKAPADESPRNSKKGPYRMTRANLLRSYDDDEEEDLSHLIGSGASDSWGVPTSTTIQAPIKRPRHGSRRTRMQMEDLEVLDPSTPPRCRLLEIPLEIRERIYGLLLDDDIMVVVDHLFNKASYGGDDRPNFDYSILGTCKQISHEARRYMYSHKGFQVSIDRPSAGPPGDSGFINKLYLQYVRHVVIHTNEGDFDTTIRNMMAKAMTVLKEAGASLETLTMVFPPQYTRHHPGCPRTRCIPPTCESFCGTFRYGTSFMRSMEKLDCHYINIVFRLPVPCSERPQHFRHFIGPRNYPRLAVISIDRFYAKDSDYWLRWDSLHPEVKELHEVRRRRSAMGGCMAKQEFKLLEWRIKSFIERQDDMIEWGVCRLLQPGESPFDGPALVARWPWRTFHDYYPSPRECSSLAQYERETRIREIIDLTEE